MCVSPTGCLETLSNSIGSSVPGNVLLYMYMQNYVNVVYIDISITGIEINLRPVILLFNKNDVHIR